MRSLVVSIKVLQAAIPSTAKLLILFDKASRLVARHQEKEHLLEMERRHWALGRT